LLKAAGAGDHAAAGELMPLVYEHLRGLARQRMAGESPGRTLQATALVHEAYLRLFNDGASERDWKSRGHFYAAAAEAMRRILIDQARSRHRQKRGGGRRRIPLDEVDLVLGDPSIDLEALDGALEHLKQRDRRTYDVAMLRHFCGLTNEQTAKVLEVSPRTVRHEWSVARLWLREAIATGAAGKGPDHD
jgi:RNA polymerase sigma factor (TIGR02999 family)